MKTRTLLLLSLGCAIAIVAAGAMLWWRVARTDDAAPTPIGQSTTIGDMNVTVLSIERSAAGVTAETPSESGQVAETLLVAIKIGGTADDDPAADFGLLVDGARREVVASDCPAVDDAEVRCALTFDGVGLGDGGGFLIYRRGDQQSAWVVP